MRDAPLQGSAAALETWYTVHHLLEREEEQMKRTVHRRQLFVSRATYLRPDHRLSSREAEILTCFSFGKTRQEVSELFGISLDTVKSHAKSIRTKLNVSNVPFAVRRGFELGILRPMCAEETGN